ncbi:MAG: hypothetical protein J5543_07670 [Bacteroidales bacterium]|nr:hypothetical protein [Bacteroidales bacterium]
MKKLLFIFLLLLSCQSDKQEAVITGTIDHWSPNSRLQLDIIADERQHAVVAEIPVSDDGTFTYSQPVDKPTVASIIISDRSIGKERITLYLQKGKSVHVDLRHVQEADGTTITILPTFSGDMQAESAFVNDNVSVDPRNFGTFTAYKDSVDKIYADRLERAQAIGNPVFVEEYLSVNDPISHHVRLVNYIPHDADLDSVETAYKDFINSLDFDDPVNEAALQQYLITYGRFVQKKNEGGSATMPALEELVRRTRNQSMRNNISSHLMFFFLMIDTPYVESVWAKYNEICNDKSQIEELRPRYDARRKELKNVKANRPLPSS